MITKHPTSRTLIIHPLGDLDTLRADHYRRQLRTLIDEGYRFLIFDLQDTPYINSSGLGLIIELYNKATRLEGTVKLIHCGPHVQWLLEQTHLNRLFTESGETPQTPTPDIPYDTLYNMMSNEFLLLAQIYEVTEQLMGQENADQIGAMTLRGIHQALHTQRGALFLLTADGKRLRMTSWIENGEESTRPQLNDFPLAPERMEQRVLEGNEVTWHELCDQDKSEDNLFYQLGFDTLITAPIRSRTRIYGLVVAEASSETMPLIQSSRPIVRTFANICGMALEKATLNEALLERNAQLNAMIERAHDYRQTLVEAGKLAALGVVISGLGHLINNKMVPLMGYTQMLSQKKDLSQWVTEKVARIQASGNEVTQIVEKLTRISKVHEKVAKPIDHGEVIRSALALLTGQIERDDITVHVRLAAEAPALTGNPDLLLQGVLAILHRACTSFAAENPERWIQITSEASETGVRVVIEDNGSPFDEYDQDGWLDPIVPFEAMTNGRIFNYTIPRSLIRKQRGKLSLEAGESGGKRVILEFPAAPAAAPVSASGVAGS